MTSGGAGPLLVSGSGGIRLAMDVEGDTGPLVVLAHGGGQSRRFWRRTAAILAGEGFRAVRYDLRGHGDSGWAPDGDYLLPAHAEDLAAITNSFDGPVAIVGSSVGGLAGLLAMATGLVVDARGLVLVDVVAHPAAHGTDRIRRFMQGAAEGFRTPGEAADAVAAYRGRPAADVAGIARTLVEGPDGRWRWSWDPAFVGAADSLAERASLLERAVPGLSAPVLLLRGGLSDVVTDEGVDQLRELLPQLVVETLPGVGHAVGLDGEEAFTELVLAFLRRALPLTDYR